MCENCNKQVMSQTLCYSMPTATCFATHAFVVVNNCKTPTPDEKFVCTAEATRPCPCILYALLTFDHANVVGAVSYRQGDGLLVFFDELHHLCFLQRGHSAADHRLARTRRQHKLHLHVSFQCVSLCGREKKAEKVVLRAIRRGSVCSRAP